MSDEVLISKLSTCLEHVDAVSSYYLLLKQNSDSKKNDSALYYDAIIMRLQALGESFKRLVKKVSEYSGTVELSRSKSLNSFQSLHFPSLRTN